MIDFICWPYYTKERLFSTHTDTHHVGGSVTRRVDFIYLPSKYLFLFMMCLDDVFFMFMAFLRKLCTDRF